jgi:hypothetical protein
MQNTSLQNNALYLAWLVALASTLGALFIGEARALLNQNLGSEIAETTTERL